MSAPAEQDWKAIAQDLAAGGESECWQQLVSSTQASVFYDPERAIYLKLFFEQRPRNRLKVRLFPSLSRHSHFVRKSRYLQELGFTVPQVLAWGDLGSTPRGDCGFVVSEAFDGMGLGSFVSQYLRHSQQDKRIRQWKRRVMHDLGREIARLHNAGISHGDLRPDNVLLGCRSPEPAFCFIDNERNKAHRFGISTRARLKNLSQLNMIWPEDLSATYRLRFIKSYLAHSAQNLDGKKLIRRVHAISQRRLEGKARGGYLNADKRQMARPDFDCLLADYR